MGCVTGSDPFLGLRTISSISLEQRPMQKSSRNHFESSWGTLEGCFQVDWRHERGCTSIADTHTYDMQNTLRMLTFGTRRASVICVFTVLKLINV